MKSINAKATFENLDYFLNYLRQFVADNAYKQELLEDLTLVTEELLVNIIYYAYPKDSPGDIKLSLSSSDQNIKIQLTDSGIPFNILEVKSTDTSLSLKKRKIGGMGIVFVKNLIDKIEYKRKAGKNILTLFKVVD